MMEDFTWGKRQLINPSIPAKNAEPNKEKIIIKLTPFLSTTSRLPEQDTNTLAIFRPPFVSSTNLVGGQSGEEALEDRFRVGWSESLGAVIVDAGLAVNGDRGARELLDLLAHQPHMNHKIMPENSTPTPYEWPDPASDLIPRVTYSRE
jgi:hypothetical protein